MEKSETNLVKIPTIEELYSNKELTLKQTALQIIVNQPPHPSWIKENNGVKYIPIGIVEFLLTSIYRKWWVEIKSIQLIANSVTAIVRLHVIDPISGEEMYNDGVGAAPVITKKDAGATEFDKILSNAVQMASPSAESYAIKDAAEKFGKIFGADVSRKSDMSINPVSSLEKKYKVAE